MFREAVSGAVAFDQEGDAIVDETYSLPIRGSEKESDIEVWMDASRQQSCYGVRTSELSRKEAALVLDYWKSGRCHCPQCL
jgi:hypothetical protein